MKKWRRSIAGCVAGNILEWYDFILYAYCASMFSVLFFPSQDPYIALIITYGVFAAGSFMRPLGGIFFGHIGDKYGRRSSLMITIALISLSTLCIGCLPTYDDVGLVASVLLMMCRLFQGAAVSGEEVGAAIFLIENAPVSRQGLAGAIILSSVYAGLLLGAMVVYWVVACFTAEHVLAYAWRIPFVCAGVFGGIAYYMRFFNAESSAFAEKKRRHLLHDSPVIMLFRHHRRALLQTIALTAVLAVPIYLFVVYFPAYFTLNLDWSLQYALLISVITLSIISIAVLAVGYFADAIGYKRVFMIGCAGFMSMAYFIFLSLSKKTLLGVMMAEILLMVPLALVGGSIFPLLIHQFPVEVRYCGVAIGFNISMTLFGSLTPLIAMMLTQYTGSALAPCAYVLFSAALSFLALLFLQCRAPYASYAFCNDKTLTEPSS